MAVITGYAHYAQIQNPGKKFQSEDLHWTVQLEVTKAVAKDFKKKYKSQKEAVKEYDTEEFTERFNVEPQASKGDEHFVITLKQDCVVNGSPFRKPVRVFMKDKDSSKLKDVTTDTLVGNCSKVAVQVREIYSKKWDTTSAKLAGIRVDSLVEYEGGDDGFSELGDVDEDSLNDELEQEIEEQEDDEPLDDDEEEEDY